VCCGRSAGENDIPGLTDEEKPRMRGPKRANNIRKLFALNKTDDVRKYVKTYSRTVEKDGKSHLKSPKIQRLITPLRLQRKRHIQSLKKRKISKVLPSRLFFCLCCGSGDPLMMGRMFHCSLPWDAMSHHRVLVAGHCCAAAVLRSVF
jgi:hypothetical protein